MPPSLFTMAKYALMPLKMSPYGAFNGLVMDATPPTLMASAVTPGGSTVVCWPVPPSPPPPPPDFDPDDSLPHAVATRSSAHAATISRRAPRTCMHAPPGEPAVPPVG